jgi:hypothetical protein
MHLNVIMCLAMAAGALMAQQSAMTVRDITVRIVSTSNTPLKQVPIDAVTTALKNKGIKLILDKFDPLEADRAGDVIRGLYGDGGQKVRVEHRVSQAPGPHSVEVEFEVIQLCSCD